MIRGRVAIALSLIAGLAVVAAAGLVWLDRRPSGREKIPEARSDDPRVMYDGPYRNVRPDVKYVGDAACAG